MKSKKSIALFIREIAVVVIGVLVALFINNWNESIKQQKFIDRTLYAIGEEIDYSINEINGVLDKHYRTIDSIDVSYDNEEETIRDVFVKLEGFRVPEVKNIGLRYFITSGAELVDYDIISDLSEIEFVNRGFDMKLSKLNDIVYNNMDSTDPSHKSMVTQLLGDLIESEESLLNLYEEFLENHKISLDR